MFMRSERLFLRPGWPEDWKELLSLAGEDEAVNDLPFRPWSFALVAWECRKGPPLPHFCITLPDEEGARLIGSIGLAANGDEIELSCWIARAYRRQGYATEAARALLSLSRALGHGRIVAHRNPAQPASAEMLLRAGFRPAGLVSEPQEPAQRYIAELAADGDQEGKVAIQAA